MMRAIGTSRRQVRQMIRYESVITALIGGVFGLVIGVVGAVLDHDARAVGLGLRAVVPGRHARDPAARRRGARRPARRAAAGAARGAPGHAAGARRRVAPARSEARAGRQLSCRAMAASPPPSPSDPELQATAWDLEPLVDGEGEEGVEPRLAEALSAREAFAARHAGQARRARRRRPARGDGASSREIHELVGRAGYYAALRFSTDTADPANGALLQRVQEQETAIQTTLLFFELEWAALAGRARRGAARRRRPGLLPPPPAQRPPLPRPPALRARGEDPRREGRSPARAPGRGCSRSSPRRSRSSCPRRDGRRRGRDASRSTSRSAACRSPTARCAARTAEAVTAALAPGPAHARLPVQHAARRQGHRRPPAPLPALAGRAQPRQRGERRVGAGADRGGPRRAMRSRAAGTG